MSSLFSFEMFVEHNHVFDFLRCVSHVVFLLQSNWKRWKNTER